MKRNGASPREARALKRAKVREGPTFSVMPDDTVPVEIWTHILAMATPNLMIGLACTCKAWLYYMRYQVDFKCTRSYSKAVHGSEIEWNYMSWMAKYGPTGLNGFTTWTTQRGTHNAAYRLKKAFYQYGNDEDFTKARIHLNRSGYWTEIEWVAKVDDLDRVKLLVKAYFETASYGRFISYDLIKPLLKAFSKHNNIPAMEWLLHHHRLRKGVLLSIETAFSHAPVEMWKFLYAQVKDLARPAVMMYKRHYLKASIHSGDIESARFAYATFGLEFPTWAAFGVAVEYDNVIMAEAIRSNMVGRGRVSVDLFTMFPHDIGENHGVITSGDIVSSEMMEYLMGVTNVMSVFATPDNVYFLRKWVAERGSVGLMRKIAEQPYGKFLKTEPFVAEILARRELILQEDNDGEVIQFFLENGPLPLSTEVRTEIVDYMMTVPADHPSKQWFDKSPWCNMADDLCFTFDANGNVVFEAKNLIRM